MCRAILKLRGVANSSLIAVYGSRYNIDELGHGVARRNDILINFHE